METKGGPNKRLINQAAACGNDGVVTLGGTSASLAVSWTPSPRQRGHELRPVVSHCSELACAHTFQISLCKTYLVNADLVEHVFALDQLPCLLIRLKVT